MEKKKSKNLIITVLCVVILVLILLYCCFAMYYSSHFLPGTIINDYICGNKTASAVARMVENETASYSLALQETDGSMEMIYAADIDLHIELAKSPEDILKEQNGWLWLIRIFGDNGLKTDANLLYDNAKLEAKIDSLKCMTPSTVKEPVDAHIELQGNTYVIVDAVQGNEVIKDKLIKVIEDAILSGEKMLNLAQADVYKQAAIQADDPVLQSELVKLQTYTGFTITIPFGDNVETISPDVIHSWLVEDKTTGKSELSFDLIEKYVEEELAYKYNTFGQGLIRTIPGTDLGRDVSVVSGDYGWWLDCEDTAKAIQEAVEAGKDAEVEPVWLQEAEKFGDVDYGNSYIELDITRQHVWIYIEGEMVFDAKVTTGNVATGMDTRVGAHRVMYYQKDATLTGEGYAEQVDYFVVFYTNTGFHDAKWQDRSMFGTDYYKNHGSHGCVRMMLEDAEQLYKYAEVGMPVFVYKS